MSWLTVFWIGFFSHSRSSPPPPKRTPTPRLLSLPDDILLEIIRHITHTTRNTPTNGLRIVEESTYRQSLGLVHTTPHLKNLVYSTLDNLCFSTRAVTDSAVSAIARNSAPSLHTLVLRACPNITNLSLFALSTYATSLRSLDLSFVQKIDHNGLLSICQALAPRLEKLLLRKCPGVTDASLSAVAKCSKLHTLDVSYCSAITDIGLCQVAKGCASSLQLFAFAKVAVLTDRTFAAIGAHCTNIIQLCARGLPHVTDAGFEQLCRGIGNTAEGIDVTLCISLTRDATLRSLSRYCNHIYRQLMPCFAARSLSQIIISTLRQNIFIVHGSDPGNRNETVHTVLIDNGDIVSASLLSSGTTDLSVLGIVLCKSYGSALDDVTKKMLENDYGIPTSLLMD